jgi:hypothetical protein
MAGSVLLTADAKHEELECCFVRMQAYGQPCCRRFEVRRAFLPIEQT